MTKTFKTITNYKGHVKKVTCLACAREKGEISIGNIARTKYFDAHQDYEIPIPGFIIISSRRHIQSIAEFTNKEQTDFMKLLYQMRVAMKENLKIKVIYLYQAEDTSHHFHMWMIPRYLWMQKKFGTRIESVRPIIEYAKKNLKTQGNLKKVENALKKLSSPTM